MIESVLLAIFRALAPAAQAAALELFVAAVRGADATALGDKARRLAELGAYRAALKEARRRG